jgi:coenzyme F420 hydrogenase subunit beta
MKKFKNVFHVVENHLCNGCGTCAGICPTDAIKMVEWNCGILRPAIEIDSCKGCGLCLNVCPGIQVQRTISGSCDPFVGEISAAYAGQITDSKLLATSQSGGIVTGLLLYALETKYIDAALITSHSSDGSLRPEVKLTSEPDEIINAQQSKYCPVALNSFLSTIRNSDKRIAIVGLPCHMHGLWNAEKVLPVYLENVVMRIGLFCDRTLTYGAVDSLIRSSGFEGQNITEFRYRSKKWRGWPGDTYIRNDKGEEVNVPREVRFIIKDDFTPARCRLCYDKLNTFADISVGDSYGLGEDKTGLSAIIIRNENIHKLILNARKAGKIKLKDVDPYHIARGQAIEERRKQFTFFSSAWKRMGYLLPSYSLNYDYTKVPETVDLSSYENALKSALNSQDSSIIKKECPAPDNSPPVMTNGVSTGSRIHPLVTIFISAGSENPFIKNAIESVLRQTYQNIELFILGDKSDTKLKKILNNMKSEKIRFFENQNKNNNSVESILSDYCHGEYIGMLEPQDEYESNKVEIDVALLLGDPRLDAIFSNLNIIDNNSKGTGVVWLFNNNAPEKLRLKLVRNGSRNIPIYSIMMRKSLSRDLNLNNTQSLTLNNQYFKQQIINGKIKHAFLPLYRYRCSDFESQNG